MWVMQPNIHTTDEESKIILKLTSAFLLGHLLREGTEG